ncbi:hypothetical protein BGZ63DRAFT_169182 [Mariannaea sp. PMI_226]|nr:hypothetical protein BGZ63DRAFT_169182 [Mariannaea sp. PMI_226]
MADKDPAPREAPYLLPHWPHCPHETCSQSPCDSPQRSRIGSRVRFGLGAGTPTCIPLNRPGPFMYRNKSRCLVTRPNKSNRPKATRSRLSTHTTSARSTWTLTTFTRHPFLRDLNYLHFPSSLYSSTPFGHRQPPGASGGAHRHFVSSIFFFGLGDFNFGAYSVSGQCHVNHPQTPRHLPFLIHREDQLPRTRSRRPSMHPAKGLVN